MLEAEPFAVKSLPFETQNECKAYINDPNNSDRLAIEVIGIAGFNDTIGAAEFGALLNNRYLCAVIVGSNSRAQARSTSANNENVCRL